MHFRGFLRGSRLITLTNPMQLPFSIEQFYAVFSAYNTTLWPAQIVLLALGLAAVGLVVFPRRWSGAAVSAILSILWAWLALA